MTIEHRNIINNILHHVDIWRCILKKQCVYIGEKIINMSRNFSEVLKSRQDNFQKLVSKVNQIASGSQNFGEEDGRFWQPTVDKDGNGYAVIRFLPAPGDEELPFVMVWDHGFQGPGGWYIEKSLTTIGQPDPCSEYNTFLWNRNQPGDRGFVSGTPQKSGSKRRLQYYSNILVIEDPANTSNNGKVFLYRYGKKIFDKLNETMNPKFPDEKPLNPFDLLEGANFKLKIRKVEGYRNYDKSEFDKPSELYDGNESVLEKIWRSEHSLFEFIDPTKFKSYADLKAKLNRVLGLVGSTTQTTQTVEVPEVKSAPAAAAVEETTPPWDNVPAEEEVDDELLEFQKLANS